MVQKVAVKREFEAGLCDATTGKKASFVDIFILKSIKKIHVQLS